uniref:Cadherin domain-containing protein n=1 Tax=Panagrellus redivivus TaxID=6233 RepID=A0A7E4VVB4_PANRE
MHTSAILALFFALYCTSLVSQCDMACVNVKQNESGSTSIRLRGSGETFFTPHKSTDAILGYVRIYFGNLPLPLSFVNDNTELAVYTKGSTYIGDALLDVTTFDIKPDGTGFVVPRKPAAASIKIPPLVEFEQQTEDKVTINLRVEWTDVINKIVIELPNHANNNPSTPPQSITSTFMSTKLISLTEVNETATTSAIPTASVYESSTVTAKVSWIVIGAVVGCIFVIIIIAAVVGAVYTIRRIRRKRSDTGLLQTPTTRVTYPSNEIHRFNIPIDPKSKITDHGINFNDNQAVVPAYPEEIREFENAEQKKKDQMYPNHSNNNASTPPKSTTSTVMFTGVINYTEQFLTATSNVSWIVIGAVVGCVVVNIVMAAVIEAVYAIRRIRRKRSATGLLQTPTTRVTYPSNKIHRFNIPIDPNSRITDHGINFNDYLAVVPAYPEEIREFENAEQKKKDEMYVGFLERIHAAERTENRGSKCKLNVSVLCYLRII